MSSFIRRLLFLGSCAVALVHCGGSTSPVSPSPSPTDPTVPFSQTDVRVGTGAEAVNGMMVIISCTGWLYDRARADHKGRMFATNVGDRYTYPFVLGQGQVIRGWDLGVVGMREGGLRRLVIPPELATGGRGTPTIPPNATLVFEIELHEAFWRD